MNIKLITYKMSLQSDNYIVYLPIQIPPDVNGKINEKVRGMDH